MTVAFDAAGETPLISVVVPTWNSAAVVERALQSLADQTFRGFEVIVSDGASTDETVAIAERFSTLVPRLRIDSRPDAGIYDAVNQAVQHSRGVWFLVLGSDDCLHAPQTLAEVAVHLQRAGDAHLVYGDVRMMAANTWGVPVDGRYIGRLSMRKFLESNMCQQSVFYRRELFDRLGGFDQRYRVCADWAFNLRAEFLKPSCWIDVVVADYAATGLSASGAKDSFFAEMPSLIRSEFSTARYRRELWPFQRRLLREADRLRRQGDWAGFFDYAGAYLKLLLRRLPDLLRRD